MSYTKHLNLFSFFCGLWFAGTGAFWVYFANLFIAYPVGLLGMYLWYRAERAGYKGTLHNMALGIHVIGLGISVGALLLFK